MDNTSENIVSIINYEGLLQAAIVGNIDVFKNFSLYIDVAKLPRDENNKTPLHLAVEYNHVELVAYILQNELFISLEDEDNSDLTAFDLALEIENSAVILKFLQYDHQKYLDYQDKNGRSALMVAAKLGDLQLAEYLLSSEADTELTDSNGFDAAAIAAINNHLKVLKLLYDYDAALDNEYDNGETLMLLGAEYGHTSIIDYMLNNGAKKSETNSNWENAVFLAASNGHTKTVEHLANLGFKLTYTNSEGCSPKNIATQQNFPETAKKIKSLVNSRKNKNSAQRAQSLSPRELFKQAKKAALEKAKKEKYSQERKLAEENHRERRAYVDQYFDPHLKTFKEATRRFVSIQTALTEETKAFYDNKPIQSYHRAKCEELYNHFKVLSEQVKDLVKKHEIQAKNISDQIFSNNFDKATQALNECKNTLVILTNTLEISEDIPKAVKKLSERVQEENKANKLWALLKNEEQSKRNQEIETINEISKQIAELLTEISTIKIALNNITEVYDASITDGLKLKALNAVKHVEHLEALQGNRKPCATVVGYQEALKNLNHFKAYLLAIGRQVKGQALEAANSNTVIPLGVPSLCINDELVIPLVTEAEQLPQNSINVFSDADPIIETVNNHSKPITPMSANSLDAEEKFNTGDSPMSFGFDRTFLPAFSSSIAPSNASTTHVTHHQCTESPEDLVNTLRFLKLDK